MEESPELPRAGAASNVAEKDKSGEEAEKYQMDIAAKEAAGCYRLPFTLFLFLSYCLFIYEVQPRGYPLEESLSDAILSAHKNQRYIPSGSTNVREVPEKAFERIKKVDHWWGFHERLMGDVIYGDWSNKMRLGSPVMRQWRYKRINCSAPELSGFGRPYNYSQCIDYRDSTYDDAAFGPAATYTQQEIEQIADDETETLYDTTATRGYFIPPTVGVVLFRENVFTYPLGLTVDQYLISLKRLQNASVLPKGAGLCRPCGDGQVFDTPCCTGPWIDRYTRKVETEFFLYAGEVGLFCRVQLMILLNSAGDVIPGLQMQVVDANDLERARTEYLMFIVNLACIVVFEVIDMINYTLNDENSIFAYFRPGAYVSWVAALYGYVIVALRLLIQETTASVSTAAQSGDTTALRDTLVDASAWQSLFKNFAAWYPLVLILQCFKVFQNQPRLTVVTDTLARSMMDLLHAFIVFCVLFGGYVVSGWILFGGHLDEFKTIGSAINTCFRAVLGDFDFGGMAAGDMEIPRGSDYDYYVAMLWFWTFTLAVTLLMLNVLIAIVLDAYQVVRQEKNMYAAFPINQQFVLVFKYILHRIDDFFRLNQSSEGKSGGGLVALVFGPAEKRHEAAKKFWLHHISQEKGDEIWLLNRKGEQLRDIITTDADKKITEWLAGLAHELDAKLDMAAIGKRGKEAWDNRGAPPTWNRTVTGGSQSRGTRPAPQRPAQPSVLSLTGKDQEELKKLDKATLKALLRGHEAALEELDMGAQEEQGKGTLGLPAFSPSKASGKAVAAAPSTVLSKPGAMSAETIAGMTKEQLQQMDKATLRAMVKAREVALEEMLTAAGDSNSGSGSGDPAAPGASKPAS